MRERVEASMLGVRRVRRSASSILPAAISASALIACAPENLALELPEANGFAAMIAAVESDETIVLEAARLDQGTPDRALFRTFRSDARITVLYYREPLEVLGLDSAPILIDREPKVRSRALPAFDRAHTATHRAGDDRFSDWEPLETLPSALAAVRIDLAKDACPPLEHTPIDLIPGARRSIAVSLAGGAALIAFEHEGRLFRIDEDARATELEAPQDFRPLSAHRAGDGTVWFSAGGRLFPWTEGQGFGAPTEDAGLELGMVTGSRDPRSFELYTLTWDGRFLHFDGAAFTELEAAQFQGAQYFLGAGQGVVWRGPRDVIALARESNEIFTTYVAPTGEVKAARTTWPFNTLGNYSAVSELAGFGTMIASRRGYFYLRRGEEFTALPFGPFEEAMGKHAINTMVALPPRSFLSAGAYDFVVEYDREGGLCAPLELGQGLDVRELVPLGEHSFLASGKSTDDPAYTGPRVINAIVRRAR